MADDTRGLDVVLLGPPTPDGEGVRVLRAREERVEAGELRALQEGRPITGEVVTLKPREDNPLVCDVQSSYTPGEASPTEHVRAKRETSAGTENGAGPAPRPRKGPAQVATQAYRDNWDEVFGSTRRDPRSTLN